MSQSTAGSDKYKASIKTVDIYSRVVALCQLFTTVDRQYNKDHILLEIAIWQKELSRRGTDTIMSMLADFDKAKLVAAERKAAVESFDTQYLTGGK